ncbi:hypothetical protein [Stutzerimonas stutzeri]|uniref:hypothetical protein n=1 Tax=Stutzerimonas stutzeri TaxID=316 RepID=UPI00265D3469|nr:hypothetical protein [Stutzerimonas stutzeri]MCF6783390.1 hypothetical protein [Stutzerimonas stutzeri]
MTEFELFGVSLPSRETKLKLLQKFQRIKAVRDEQERTKEVEIDDGCVELSLEAFGYAEALHDLGHLSAAEVIKIGEAFKAVLGAK